MIHAVVPFIIYLIIQIIVFFVGVNFDGQESDYGYSSFLRTYIIGQLAMFALIEILAVPMILLRWNFNVLYWSFIILSVFLFSMGLRTFITSRKIHLYSIKEYLKSSSLISIITLVLAVLLIAGQFVVYFGGQHLDEDDARWMAEANDAIEYGDMMTRSFYTGEYQGSFTAAKDVTSPWAMMWAILARTMHTRVSISLHTVYASFELLIMYMIYYMIARELFDKRDSRFTFLLSVAVINMFYAGTVFTQSVFSMIRIWQGKATVAAVIIPLLLYIFICINKRNENRDWRVLPVICCGSCLLSGMGVSLSAMLIAIYGIYNIVFYKNWKRIPIYILSMVPSIVFSLIYFFFKG